jgi:hypothetical protein
MGALSQAREIILEVQSKMNNEKIARRKINFSTYKTCSFSFFLLFGPSFFQNFKLSHFLFILNDLCHKNATFNFTNHL